jgi:colanic acid/amylovoran biosynthesis glycosyltransferase
MSAPTSSSAPGPVAYLVNQYPKVSHTFIRREIHALERRGIAVHRYASRGWADAVADPVDEQERSATRYLLRGGLPHLLAALVRRALAHPAGFLRALGLTWRLSRGSDRPWLVHLAYLAQACRLAAWLCETRARHLHAHFGTNPPEVAWLAHLLGGPRFSFTVHGPEEFDKPAALHLREKISAAAFVVAVSSYGRSQLMRWSDAKEWTRLHVVHCGLDGDFLDAVASDPPAVPRVVCVGRLCEQKGQLLLVHALARIVEGGTAADLVLAGDGEMRADIEASVAARGVGHRVRITGWIGGSAVREELAAARALVLPSFAEGLPVVIMEAMALRRPVLSTYVAGIPELVRDGQEGWLVPPGDVDALTVALKACLDAPPATLATLGAAAQRRVRIRHDIDHEAGRLADLFLTAYSAPAA